MIIIEETDWRVLARKPEYRREAARLYMRQHKCLYIEASRAVESYFRYVAWNLNDIYTGLQVQRHATQQKDHHLEAFYKGPTLEQERPQVFEKKKMLRLEIAEPSTPD